ncbi:MAG: NUDIX domain-containing protein [Deltaproteobacteria bacterium]|nr:NUDIX domain-containing protein [Deltaproteobacteria bacterium]
MPAQDRPRESAVRPTEAERDFLAAYDAAAYPHPSVTVDVALVTAAARRLRALLVRRHEPPCSGTWALPGGFVGMAESPDEAAVRVLEAKVGLRDVYLEQLYTFGAPNRDPRTRVITIAYYALVDVSRLEGLTGLEHSLAALRVPWEGERGGPVDALGKGGKSLPLAFDHADILGLVVKRLRGKLNYTPVGFQLLPPEFTLRHLQEVHETILGHRVNKDSFRRRMLASGLLTPTGESEGVVGHRPAALYRFTQASAA